MASGHRKVLMEYTKDKNIKMRMSEVEKARSDELARRRHGNWRLGKEKILERELKAKAK